MKILFVGVLDVSWSTNVEMKKSLTELGHDVVDFNYRTEAERLKRTSCSRFFPLGKVLNKGLSFSRRYRWLPRIIRSSYYRIEGRAAMNSKLIKNIRGNAYDLVIFAKTDTVDPQLIAGIDVNIKTWYYFMDPPDTARKIDALAYARNCTYASTTFSDVYQEFKKVNGNTFYLNQGYDPDVFFPDAEIDKDIDVSFVGTKTKHRTKYIEEIRSRGIAVVCYGFGWNGNTEIFLEELVDCYRRSKIVLNLGRKGEGFSNPRVFQVIGSEAFLISEYRKDLSLIFEAGVHLDWAVTPNEMADKVSYYLNNYDLAERISRTGYEYVRNEKNWTKLMGQLIDFTNAPVSSY